MKDDMTKIFLIASILAVISLGPQMQPAFADYQEDLNFAAGLEETLGHFWAMEQNLNEANYDLALVHATHPVAELYDLIKPDLQASDPELDVQVYNTLIRLQDNAGQDVTQAQARNALDAARDVVKIARSTVVGDDLSNDTGFKMDLIKGLLETSVAEYGEGVQNGAITQMAEFQDGSAFVWRSQQIFEEIKPEIGLNEAEVIEAFYDELWDAYDATADPDDVSLLAAGIIEEINKILGTTETQNDLLYYVETINALLEDARVEYRQGNTDIALSHVTRAYLDNYEFLEGPLIKAGQRELMEEVEIMIREDLRETIRSGAPVSQVDAKIDAILEKMDEVAVIVPEFGAMAAIVLAVSVVAILAVTSRLRPGIVPRL